MESAVAALDRGYLRRTYQRAGQERRARARMDFGSVKRSAGLEIARRHRDRLIAEDSALSEYLNALTEAGLRLVRMLEPAPPQGFIDKAPEYQDAATIPRLLVLITEKH